MENPEKKGLFARFLHSFKSGVKDSADSLAGGGALVSDFVKESGKFLWDGLSDSMKSLLEGLQKTGEMVVDQTTGTVGYLKNGIYYVGGKAVEGTLTVKDGIFTLGEDVIGTVKDGVYYAGDTAMEGVVTVRDGIYYVGDKALESSVVAKDSILSVGGNVVGTLVNTTKFITDSEYRETVGIPWLKQMITANQKILAYQMQQNRKSLDIVYRYALGHPLEAGEQEIATKQLTDMAKLVPAFAIFLLPGGMVLLPLFAKLLPWELIPDLKPPESVEQGEGASESASPSTGGEDRGEEAKA
jgi:hypothetical protein